MEWALDMIDIQGEMSVKPGTVMALRESLQRVLRSPVPCRIYCKPYGIEIMLSFYRLGSGAFTMTQSDVECCLPSTLDQILRYQIGEILRELARKFYLT